MSSVIWRAHNFVRIKRQKIERKWRSYRHITIQGTSSADPKKLLFVNPNSIDRETTRVFGSTKFNPGVILGGEWDKHTVDFSTHYKVKSMVDHFQNNFPWEKTPYFKKKLNTIRATGRWKSYSSQKELYKYFEYLDKLYESIREHGYKNNQQYSSEVPDEIGVNIGRDGDLYFHYNGHHRLCMAQILGIAEVPVVVYARHSKWEYIRRQIKKSQKIDHQPLQADEYHSHPDITSYS